MIKENLFLAIVVGLVSLAVVIFAIKATLFIGWAIGGGLGIILALLFLFGILDLGWFFGFITFIIILNFLFDLF